MIRRICLWLFAQMPPEAQFACVDRWTGESDYRLARRQLTEASMYSRLAAPRRRVFLSYKQS